MKVRKIVKEFLKHTAKQVESGDRSPATLRFYECRFKPLKKILGSMKWEKLKVQDVLKYLEESGKGLSPTTRSHDVTALKTLQNFAVSVLGLPRVFEKIEKPRANRRERFAKQEDVDRLLTNASPAFSAIYRALFQTGCRPGEMCQLTIDQIDWTATSDGTLGVITIKEHKTARKTGQSRFIPIGEKFAVILREAIGERTAGTVFLTESGRKWNVSYLAAVHRELREKAGLDKALVPYSARHGFATKTLGASKDIKAVSELLGHSSVTMTERYTHPDVKSFGNIQNLA